jgi:hypothetical protein
VGELNRPIGPTRDGSDLVLEVECRPSRTVASGSRHEVRIRPDWSVVTPHDLGAERVAAAFGGYTSCLELADRTIPACRELVPLLARKRSPEMAYQAGRGWRFTRWSSGCGCGGRFFAEARHAAVHLRSPDHVAATADAPLFQVAAVLNALRKAHLEFRPPRREWSAAAKWVRETKGLDELWASGLPLSIVTEAVAQFPVREPYPVRFFLGLAFREVDRPWLAEVLERVPDPDVATWLAWTRAGRDPRDPALLGRWLATGVSRDDVEVLAQSGSTWRHVTEVAHQLGRPVRVAAVVLAQWYRVGCRPSGAHLKLLDQLGIAESYRPSGSAIDAIEATVSVLADPPSRTELGVMLALAGTRPAVVEAVFDGRFTPLALAASLGDVPSTTTKPGVCT